MIRTLPETLTAPAPVEPRTPAEPTTPIKPSEALRLGRLRYPIQAFGSLTTGAGSRCALGAIWAVMDMDTAWEEVQRRCPARGRFLRCSLTCSSGGIVLHLNDNHLWPDSRIVAWLESLGL